MRKIKLLGVTLLLTFLTACSAMTNSNPFYIDNPTQESISVNIDGKDYLMETKSMKKIDLKPGEHKMTLQDGTLVNFKVSPFNEGGIINPTKSLYAIYSMVYAVEGEEDGFDPFTSIVYIDGVDYEGAIKTTADMFIDNNVYRCEYMLREPFPETKTTYDKNYTGNIISKYFDKDEFINFYEEETNSIGYHEENKTKEETIPTNTTITNISELSFQDPKLQSYLEESLIISQKIKQANSEKEWKEAYDEYTACVLKISEFGFIENKEEQDKMEQVVQELTSIVSLGIYQTN